MNWREFKKKYEHYASIVYDHINARVDSVIIYYKELRMKEWVQKLKSEIFKYIGKFFKTIVFLIIVVVSIAIIAPFFGYKINLKKMFFQLAQIKGIPLEPIETQLTLYQTNAVGQTMHDLTKECAIFNYVPSEEQKFYLAIKNNKENNTDLINPVLTIRFMDPEDIEVRLDEKASEGWVPTDPSGSYFYRREEVLQPTKLSVNNRKPLFLKFKKEKFYKVFYEISGKNEVPVPGEFNIKVGNPPHETFSYSFNDSNLKQSSVTSAHTLTRAGGQMSVSSSTVVSTVLSNDAGVVKTTGKNGAIPKRDTLGF